ncbi:MAG: PGPGW domain-containing protein [Acidimicrobiia bacterium]
MRTPATLKGARRLVVAVLGGTIVLVGLALLVLPGPGLLFIAAGLALLGTEFVWARSLMSKIRRQSQRVKERVG